MVMAPLCSADTPSSVTFVSMNHGALPVVVQTRPVVSSALEKSRTVRTATELVREPELLVTTTE